MSKRAKSFETVPPIINDFSMKDFRKFMREFSKEEAENCTRNLHESEAIFDDVY